MSAGDVRIAEMRAYAKIGAVYQSAPGVVIAKLARMVREAADALEASRAEFAALRRQVEELRALSAGVVTVPDGFDVFEFASTGGANGFPRIQRKGPTTWAAYANEQYCYGKDGNLHPEPLPSSRSDEFIALTRFPTPHEAACALRSGEAGKGKA